MPIRNYYILSLAALLLLAIPANAGAKTIGNDKDLQPSVIWVSQFPAWQAVETKKNSFKRIYDFLVQKGKDKKIGRPIAIVANSPTDYWIVDQGGKTIFKVENKKVRQPFCIKDKEDYFSSLVGSCKLPDGRLLFSDSKLNQVFIISADGKSLSTLGDSMTFGQPTGIAWNPATHEFWVVETGAHRIAVLNEKGVLVRRIGSRGDGEGQFNFPTSICIDKAGDAYIVDAMNFRVQILNKSGGFVTKFGESGDASGTFARPKGICVDSYGHIYIADALFHVVQIFDRAGTFLYSFGSQGREKEQFWMPAGLFIDENNFIYVADSYNSRVQVFQLINGFENEKLNK